VDDSPHHIVIVGGGADGWPSSCAYAWRAWPRARAAHQPVPHLQRLFPRHLYHQALAPLYDRDFGSPVSLGACSTVGGLMGKLIGA